ncbi:hypothetical protein EYF80_000981 [Liparis tanakae]|uniref:Uncharacterized protein n=1 Tax=Liparis tanakae TaxID=230148 RepID=A0A4Z2JEG5_9TELE|nr:hypothetical protein EYF80_000981 [Liparis tanakae]
MLRPLIGGRAGKPEAPSELQAGSWIGCVQVQLCVYQHQYFTYTLCVCRGLAEVLSGNTEDHYNLIPGVSILLNTVDGQRQGFLALKGSPS